MTLHFQIRYVASFLRGMRDLLPATSSGRFAPSVTVVIFYYFGAYVASFLRGTRDLGLPDLIYRLSFHYMHTIESYLLRCTQKAKKYGMTAYAVIPRSKNHILRGY